MKLYFWEIPSLTDEYSKKLKYCRMNAQVHWETFKARDIFHIIVFGFLNFIVQEQRNLQSFSMIHVIVGAEFFLELENDVTVHP